MSSRPPLTVRHEPPPDSQVDLVRWGWVALLVATCALAFGGGALSCLALRQSGALDGPTPSLQALLALPAAFRNEPFARTNVLVLGADLGRGLYGQDDSAPTHSDTMIVASLDSRRNRLTLLTLPRDTRVTPPGCQGPHKLNEAFYLGGPVLACRTVSELLGVPVTHWVRLKLAGLSTLVDALGGIDMTLVKPMRYRDRTAGLVIDLKAGKQRLTGVQAEHYVRFRHDEDGDIGRVERQQLFIRALVAKLQDSTLLARLPHLLSIAQQAIETDLPPEAILHYANWAKQLGRDRLRLVLLPGDAVGPATPDADWVVDRVEVRRLATRLLIDATASAFVPNGVTIDPKEKAETRIAILNGTRRAGLGSEAARLLRQDGWTIWEVGTAPHHDHTETEILTQRGDERLARAISQILRVPGHPSNDSTPELACDFTVLLGDDFTMALRQSRLHGAAEEDTPPEEDDTER